MFAKLIKLRDDQFIIFDQTLQGRGDLRYLSRYDWGWREGGRDIPQRRHVSLTASVDFRHQPASLLLITRKLPSLSSLLHLRNADKRMRRTFVSSFIPYFPGTNYSIKLTRLPAKLSRKETRGKNK